MKSIINSFITSESYHLKYLTLGYLTLQLCSVIFDYQLIFLNFVMRTQSFDIDKELSLLSYPTISNSYH